MNLEQDYDEDKYEKKLIVSLLNGLLISFCDGDGYYITIGYAKWSDKWSYTIRNLNEQNDSLTHAFDFSLWRANKMDKLIKDILAKKGPFKMFSWNSFIFWKKMHWRDFTFIRLTFETDSGMKLFEIRISLMGLNYTFNWWRKSGKENL